MREARFLDPRPAEEAEVNPILHSVNIPLAELRSRLGELPPKGGSVVVVGDRTTAEQAAQALETLGRPASLAPNFSYGPAGGRLWRPNALLAQVVENLPPGSALDLGCGQGRDAVYLASLGWQVSAIDRLPDAIELGKALERRYLGTETIHWRVGDVLSPEFQAEAEYDLVLMLFLFDRALLERAPTWLRPGGSLVVEAFTTIRQQTTGKPASPDRVVKPGELAELVDRLEIVRYEETDGPKGHTAKLWARSSS